MNINEELKQNVHASYRVAEQKAAHYFASLSAQLAQKNYASTLIKDIQSWKKSHTHPFSLFSLFSHGNRKSGATEYHNYIQWLNYTGQLDSYLDRSISYIYMRDLGKALDSPDIQSKVQHGVERLKNHLINRGHETKLFSTAWLYRWAQKEGVESTVIWLMDKLKTVSSTIPQGMDATEAQRKLIKIIGGVVMHAIEEMDTDIPPKERTGKLEEAMRLGYCYGLTYPFIDDLLDANVLSEKEKKRVADLIRTTLVTRTVPKLDEWTGRNADLIRYIHSELGEAFTYIKNHQRPEASESFFEQSYVFFNAQEVDRTKDLSNANYTNEELYIPVILKSSYSRLITRSIIDAPEDEGFDNRTFLYGIYNQLADDFADMFEDMEEERVTPYTYYIKYHDTRQDLINPFELYWTVISNLMHNVYHSDRKTCEVMLARAINGLKRFKKRLGTAKYNEIMKRFVPGNPIFSNLIQKMVRKADNVDFFDKLLRDHMVTMLKNERQEQEDFFETIKSVREQINHLLSIPFKENTSLLQDRIIEAADYSLAGDAKRLRPIMTWVMGVNGYGLNESTIVPLLKSLEYMHTASLIFDDLPSQDNASTRRGRPTLHQVYNSATAELTGLFLTQKAMEEQASLDQFDPQKVLRLIQYSSQTTANMCRGQAMDLDSKGKRLTLEQLNTMCFYKTGIAFEASLIMPAILAGAKESEMEALKMFARHAGIAFQIKDDLLDVAGDPALLGKSIGKDADNNNSTFVSILGVEEAKKAMWEHYCYAVETLQEVPQTTPFLKHLSNYIVNRDT